MSSDVDRERLQAALGDRYRLGSTLGRGGMATVYRATDVKHERDVAIKVLHPDIARHVDLPERFLREIRIAARLTHPQILPLHDSGEARVPGMIAPFLFYVMPLMAGESLRARLDRERRLPIDQALRIARAAAGALDYAHRQGILHRDIKPENILLHEGEAVVADFGVARAIGDAGGEVVTEPGLAVGTPAYMSPEQASGERELDGRSDQYALGCVVYEMLTGQPPFAGTGARATMARHAVEPPAPLRSHRPEVPPAVESAVLRALAKDPAQRFPSVLEFAEALVTPLSGLTGSAWPTTPGTRSIAVLPFVNTSADPENEYFSDGMTDELINALAQVSGLLVASRTSVFAVKGRREDVRSLGALLNVTSVLEGTVRKAGNRVRITAQLTSVADGRLLWSERFDREVADIFAIQDEIAQTIVQTLRVNLLGELGDTTPRRYTENLKAYNLYLRGRYCWNLRTGDGITQAIRCFEAAIVEDPGYALAYTGLADAYALHVDYRAMPVEEGLRRAKVEAEKALQLDDTLAEAHTSLGWVRFIHEWDWQGATASFERAIALNPRYATARQWYSWLLVALGRIDESLAMGRKAVELDPASVSIRRSLGWLNYYVRRPLQAIEELQRTLIMNPLSFETHLILGLACTQAGRLDEAAAALREVLGLAPEDTHAVAALAHIAILRGDTATARSLYEGLLERARSRYVSPTDLAKAAIVLGEHDRAFEWIERSWAERRGWLAYLRVEPLFDPLRKDPRFRELVRRMHL